MTIHYIRCSIFDLEKRVQTLVNPVNCRGAMGKGLAKQFKERYPAMFEAYGQRCTEGKLTVGRLYLWRPSRTGATWILHFPTKDAWNKPSTLAIIEAGLKRLLEIYQEAEISSIAFPLLGCGEGGLDWAEVQPLMERYLNKLKGVDVYIAFPPQPGERRTMLPRYFLNFLDLGAEALYQAEVKRLPDVSSLTEEQRQWLVTRARANEDKRARPDLMLCCLAYVLRRAAMIQEERRPQQEMLDLVQEANVAMLEVMDRALKTYDPISTLCRIARRAMIQACIPPEKRSDQHPTGEGQHQKKR